MAEEFDLSELLAAPIRALNEAEAAAATRFVELLLDYSLEDAAGLPSLRVARASPEDADGRDREAPSPSLRQLSFEMERIDADGQTRTHSLTVPLLQLLPFGGVSIEQATLNYGLTMRVSHDSAAGARPAPGAPPVSRFSGRLAQSRGTSGAASPVVDANLQVEVKLRQMDMPQGLLDLIQHTQGIVRREIPAADPEGPRDPSDGTLFRVDVLGTSRDLRKRRPEVRLVLRVTPRSRLSGALTLRFDESPPRAFRIIAPARQAQISGAMQFELALSGFNSEGLAMLAGGRLAVMVSGKGVDESDGADVAQTVLVMLPPVQTGEPQR